MSDGRATNEDGEEPRGARPSGNLARWNPWRGLGGLSRELWFLFFAVLINRMGTMVLPFFVLYLTKEMGFTPRQAGFFLSIYGAGALVAAPLAGRLCDRVGSGRVMAGALAASTVVLFLFPFARSDTALVTVTVALAVFAEAFRPASMATLTRLAQPERRKQAFAAIRLAVNLGMSVGPAVAGLLATVSFRAIFWINGATSIAAALFIALSPLVRDGALAPPAKRARRAPEGGAAGAGATAPPMPAPAFRDARYLLFLATSCVIAMIFFQHEGAMPIYMVRDLGLAESTYGLVFTINTLLVVLFEVQLNGAMAGWSHGRSLALGTLLLGAGFGALAFCREFWGIVVTVVIWTFGEIVTLPTMSAYVADIAPRERQGEYMGFYTMAFGIAFSLGPWLGTEVLDRWGATWLWGGVFAASVLVAAGLAKLPSPAAARAPKGEVRAA